MQEVKQPKQPDPLKEARQLFLKQDYQQSKALLQSIKNANQNIELNLFLTEHKINPDNSDIVLKALMDRLTEINIKLYQENINSFQKGTKSTKNPIKHISHEFYYWNIIVIAQQIGKLSIAALIGNQSLHFWSCFRSKTALMIIYEMLKQMSYENRLASCGSLVMKFQEIVQRAKHLTVSQQIYRTMNHIMWSKIFLRLGFIDESLELYKSKLSKSQQEMFESAPNLLPLQIYREFLHAQIEYFKQNYKESLAILSEVLTNVEINDKIAKTAQQNIINLIESNIAAIFMNMSKVTVGRKLALKTNGYFRKSCQEQNIDNERFSVFQRSKQLLFYSFLKSDQYQLTKEDYAAAFHLMKRTETNKSYKLIYRKGQMCVQYLNNLIHCEQSSLPYKQIVDNFECSYFYINEPYFQSKNKNKNPIYLQGKRYYRRYVLKNWDDKGFQKRMQEDQENNQQAHPLQVKINDSLCLDHQSPANDTKNLIKSQQFNEDKTEKKKRKVSNITSQQSTKDKKNTQEDDIEQKKKSQSQPKDKQNGSNTRLNSERDAEQVTFQAITYFKQSLSLLEQENKVILTFQTNEGRDFTERVNLKIYQDYRIFKQSILMNLCYLYLLRQNWIKVLQHAEMYRKFIAYDKESNTYQTQNIKNAYNQQEYFSVLSYELEAYCQFNQFTRAYETMQDIIQIGYPETASFQASSSINGNLKNCFIEETNQYHNLMYTIAVLQMRDNRLPQAHQSLQKILTETNILPNRSSFKTPLSVNDLLLHYHLRTGDRISALEILKRRRVMGMGGVNGVYNVLKVTK